MKRVCVIGGGASGLTAAINLAKENYDVTILERNNTLGKKILLTGNGKCNFWNNDQNNKHYHSSNNEILKEILTKENKDKGFSFLTSLGFIYKEKNGYLYPNSNQASTIQELLIEEVNKNNIKVYYDTLVSELKKENDRFIIKTNNGLLEFEKVIIASGSCAMPKTGSDGSGYKLAQMLGHSIKNTLPALVQLTADEYYLQNWAGIRQDVKVKTIYNNELIEEEGEIQLTNYGISGICVMQLSFYIANNLSKNHSSEVIINFLPDYDKESLNKLIENYNLKNKNIQSILCGMLNKKLVNVLLELSKIKNTDYWDNISFEKRNTLLENIVDFKLKITGTKGFENAQVCAGGVSLEEINPKNLESKLVKNLYFCGEILDCNGDCGGYNLAFAWITGSMVGKDD